MKRTVATVAGLLGLAGAAHAERPPVEVGGIVGLRVFNDDSGFGVDDAPDADSQRNTALFGLRLGVYFSDRYGAELEAGVLPGEGRSMLYDVWNLAIRASVVAQLRVPGLPLRIRPFGLVGAGSHTILSSGNEDAIGTGTAPVVHLGGGLKYDANNGFGIRLDARLLLPPSSASGGPTLDFELLGSVYRDFGWRKPPVKLPPPPPPPPPVDEDPDKDSVVGAADACPKEPEDRDGFRDEDGCPDLDNDEDGVPDVADKCPEPEDRDGFKDDDGCPDLDNDEDGVLDAADRCGTEAETRNGYLDDDGCADELPERVRTLTTAPLAVAWKPGTAELGPGAAKLLDDAAAVLTEVKEVSLELGVHTDDQPPPKGSKYADNQALSQDRAEAVKAYLVGKGIDAARLTARGYGDGAPLEDAQALTGPKQAAARAKNRRVELKLVVPAPQAPPAAPTPPAPAPSAPSTAPAPAAPASAPTPITTPPR
ncbi:MAG TPA: OmpA family protein [Kofleriaceae bacterium]|nr:OmpA family protein [Kofleriaceae bacterium]